MENEINIKEFVPIEGYNNYFINNKGVVIETKIVKIYKTKKGYSVVKLNKSNKSLIQLFAKAFIKNPHNYKNAILIDKNKNISIENVKFVGAGSHIKINVYLAKNFINHYDIEYCNKIFLQSYDNIEVMCKNLNINRTTYTRNVNKKIFKPKKLNTYIYIETFYEK